MKRISVESYGEIFCKNNGCSMREDCIGIAKIKTTPKKLKKYFNISSGKSLSMFLREKYTYDDMVGLSGKGNHIKINCINYNKL